LGSVGVRVWWASGAPQREAKLAALTRERQSTLLLEQAQAAVNANPNDWHTHDHLAGVLLARGEPDKALAEARLATKVAPREKAAWQALANAYLAQRRLAAAEETYRAMAQKWPQDSSAYEGLAAVLRHTGRFQEALKAARQAVRYSGERPEPHYILGALIQEVGARSPFTPGVTPLLEEGREQLLIAAKKMPDHPDLLYRLGRICSLTRRHDEARRALDKAVAGDPSRTVAWIALSEARISTGILDGSVDAARKACETGPLEPEAQLALGRALLLRSDRPSLEEAAVAFQEAARRNPGAAEPQRRLGTALMKLDRVREAGAAYEAASQLDPSDPYSAQQLAQIYQRVGDKERAAQAAKLSQVLTTNQRLLDRLQRTSVAHPENALVHRALADRYQELGWLPQAEDEYQAALALTPKDARSSAGLSAVRRKLAEKRPQ
jgi:tetratricopeptide (TPR) repeat protein